MEESPLAERPSHTQQGYAHCVLPRKRFFPRNHHKTGHFRHVFRHLAFLLFLASILVALIALLAGVVASISALSHADGWGRFIGGLAFIAAVYLACIFGLARSGR